MIGTSFPAEKHETSVAWGNTPEARYHKVAEATLDAAQVAHTIVFFVSASYMPNFENRDEGWAGDGILRIRTQVNNDNTGLVHTKFDWLIADKHIPIDDFLLEIKGEKAELWVRTVNYIGYAFTVIHEFDNGNLSHEWTVHPKPEPTSNKLNGDSGYTEIKSKVAKLHEATAANAVS